MFDPSDIRQWRSLKAGSIVMLKDEQTMAMVMEATGTLKPAECVVDEVMRVVVNEGVGEFLFCHMENPIAPGENGTDLWLTILFVDGKHDHRLYFEPADRFEPGTREEILNRGDNFIFLEPETDNFEPSDLEFSERVFYGGRDYDGEGDPTLFGEATISPQPQGLPSLMFTAIRELWCRDADNPRMMIIEIDGVTPDGEGIDGGLIRLWLGRPLGDNDFEVIPGRL
jgi:hypothetical protein